MKLDPLKLGCDCAQCPYAVDGKPTRPVFGEGPERVDGVLIGEGPGPDEDRRGRPFVGATGAELDGELLRAKIARAKMFVVNAEACLPRGPKPKQELPRAVKCCAPLFDYQMRPYLKKPAFVMGRGAWQTYAGEVPKGGVEEGRGFLRKSPFGTPYIASFHPTYAFFRNPYVWGAFSIDLERFKRMMQGRLRARPEVVPNATWRDVKKLLSLPGPYAVDVETAPAVPDQPWTGKQFHIAKLRIVGAGNQDFGVSCRWDTADARTRNAFRWLVKNRLCIYQNGPWADHRVLTRYGFRIGQWEDTRDGRRALSATSKLDLGWLATLYDDCPVWWSEGLAVRAPKNDAEWTELMVYNGIDCCETARSWWGETTEKDWETPRVQRLYKLHKDLSVIAAEMNSNGFQTDWWNRYVLAEGLQDLYEKRLKKLAKLVGLSSFKGTPQNMRALIFKRHETPEIHMFGLPDPLTDDAYTESGDCSVDEEALLRLITEPDCPPLLRKVIDAYWQAAAPLKARSTYITSDNVEHAIGEDGRCRSGWNSCGADTGRWSDSEPNLMNLSEEKD